jgi:hypothetical protein
MFNANAKVNFKINTARKGEHFSLAWEGQLTMQETMTKKELAEALVQNFLAEINGKPSSRLAYQPSEVKVSLTAA